MVEAAHYGGVTVQVAADLYGRKENLFVRLGDAVPPLGDLVQIIEAVYEAEAQALRPGRIAPPPFEIQYMQSFDESTGWSDITSARQIHDGMQLFVFQPRNDVHSDSQDLIPVAKDPVLQYPYVMLERNGGQDTSPYRGTQQHPHRGGGGSPQGSRSPVRASMAMSSAAPGTIISERTIVDTFKRLDTGGAGAVGLYAVRQGFSSMGVDLSPSTIASLFGMSAPKGNPDRREVDMDDWFAFATTHPKIIRSLGQYPEEVKKERQREREREATLSQQQQADAQRRLKRHIHDKQRQVSTLQRAQKEVSAKSQARASDRLAKGKSCVLREVDAEEEGEGGGGGDTEGGGPGGRALAAAEERVAMRSRRAEEAKPVAWKPAGLKRTASQTGRQGRAARDPAAGGAAAAARAASRSVTVTQEATPAPLASQRPQSRSRTPAGQRGRGEARSTSTGIGGAGTGGYTAVPSAGHNGAVRSRSTGRPSSGATAIAAARESTTPGVRGVRAHRQSSPTGQVPAVPLSAIGQLRQQVYGGVSPTHHHIGYASVPPLPHTLPHRERKSTSPARRQEAPRDFSTSTEVSQGAQQQGVGIPTTAAYSAVESEILRQYQDPHSPAAMVPRLNIPPRDYQQEVLAFQEQQQQQQHLPHQHSHMQRCSMSPPPPQDALADVTQILSPGGSCIPAPVMPPAPAPAPALPAEDARWGQWQPPPPPALPAEEARPAPSATPPYPSASASALPVMMPVVSHASPALSVPQPHVPSSRSVTASPAAAVPTALPAAATYTPHYRPHLAHLQQQQQQQAWQSPVLPSPAPSQPPAALPPPPAAAPQARPTYAMPVSPAVSAQPPRSGAHPAPPPPGAAPTSPKKWYPNLVSPSL